ncbi:phospho-sugar mutase [Isoptericola sp. b441]|uniref:Phospho-sugar mutase n=1 Tax=Actinotalea lenta TaxID=3064654 RepID=A0ABT9DC92_9CELL|nr:MULTISPECIES: phospho-sugar mutase [unclassified Isoptericola]MDO8106916.1 phospho-sugar mutase [Isoptericola sp. b441]MDO8121373.1 phospho-sugar mutase [Isoptericola sp. b490]
MGRHSAEAPDLPDELLAEVHAWIEDDPDPVTAAQLRELADRAASGDADARADLADRFAGTLEFGTAGLRGALGGGPNRMNRAVVIRAAAGLTHFLTEALAELGEHRPRVVIGYDARYNSDVFARDTAAVVTAAGGEALLLPRPLPTPVLAFAVQHLGADAGVTVTASHNPPQDNGYKVYLGGRVVTDAGRGAQIVPPYDRAIADRIAAVDAVAHVARAEHGWTVLGEEIVSDYLDAVATLRDEGPRDLRVVLTPLHGVGGALVEQVLRDAGFTDLHVVPEQAEPDPDFPTVAFPNPEEPGAIDLALDLARRVQADLVIANDPDADRCAAATVDPHTGEWRMLHGDEVGALLGEQAAGLHAGGDGVLACSIVSSRLLGRIAAAHGLAHAQTLTGFKWISRTDRLVFGYEEALGYCCDPAHVRDKDGLSAALLLAQLAARTKADGRGLVDLLDDLARRHGLHVSDQLAARFSDLAQIPATMDRVRQAPPATLAGSPVSEVVDLAHPDPEDPIPPTDGLRLLAEDGTRVVIRPSGTEPKVKCYLEVVMDVDEHADDEALGAARRAARTRLDAVRQDLTQALGL